MSKFIVPEIQTKFGDIELYDYQVEAVTLAINHARVSKVPAYIYASVSAGKSLMIAAIAKHFQRVNEAAEDQGFKASHQVMMLVRAGELVKQNSEEAWGIRCKNSVWCSGLIPKSQRTDKPFYSCVMGSEKSVYNSLDNELADVRPTILLLDEAHTVAYDNEDSVIMRIIAELRVRNPNLRIIGFTGSPWRGRDKILDAGFWGKELARYDRTYLTKLGFVKPVEYGFGVGDAHYDSFMDYTPEEEGDCDLTASQLAKIEQEVLKDGTKTQAIMLDIMRVMQNRNCALLTLAGEEHCQEAAKYLPDGSYAIITQKTSLKERLRIKEACNSGDIKYVLQIGCWTVGVSIPRVDTIPIMRLIGSKTLYEQLIGRGVRNLKQHDIDAGIVKNECLVLDYTDTSAIMAQLFSDDELDEAENKRAKQFAEELIQCPKCGHENSSKARRCSGRDSNGSRCDYFFSYVLCEDMHNSRTGVLMKRGCNEKNDPSSRVCRSCGGSMKDPNENLMNTAYSKKDLIPVTRFTFGLTKSADKLIAQYWLANGKKAKQIFDITSKEKWRRAEWYKFLKEHVVSKVTVSKLSRCYNATDVVEHINEFRAPLRVTHRVNGKGFDLIARKIFDE